MDIRKMEKTKKYGYLFWISYNGKKFHSFDENNGEKTVKLQFKNIINKLDITWAKGIQQAARTDAKVSANQNILYISTYFNGDLDKLKSNFNKNSKGMKITKIEKVLPNLVIPDLVKEREYFYEYPNEKIEISQVEIKDKCLELSGTYDVSEFTDYKGKQLKKKIRRVNVSYANEKLIFRGDSFMPKQVRIMSGYILGGEKKIYPAKYLTLNKVILKEEIENYKFKKIENIKIDLVEKIEKVEDVYFFFVKKENKSEIIGKNGKNIKKLRRDYGKIIVKDVQ
ncbi:MAG: pseudouridylate synthase [Fusobacteriia bacterium 4572_132]|nr:MAG: pseudouridylate synthase [Fusobacteriia bacterium 4572_132]